MREQVSDLLTFLCICRSSVVEGKICRGQKEGGSAEGCKEIQTYLGIHLTLFKAVKAGLPQHLLIDSLE